MILATGIGWASRREHGMLRLSVVAPLTGATTVAADRSFGTMLRQVGWGDGHRFGLDRRTTQGARASWVALGLEILESNHAGYRSGFARHCINLQGGHAMKGWKPAIHRRLNESRHGGVASLPPGDSDLEFVVG